MTPLDKWVFRKSNEKVRQDLNYCLDFGGINLKIFLGVTEGLCPHTWGVTEYERLILGRWVLEL